MARELSLDLNQLKGTGEKGRITREDLKAALAKGAAAPAGGGALPAVPQVDFAKFGPIETVPLSRIKKISGPRLHASWVNIPHVTRRIIGRQASIDGVDGSQTYASVFFHNRRLYQIEGTAPAGGATADAIRFQQSFDFTDGWRLPDALSNELRAR